MLVDAHIHIALNPLFNRRLWKNAGLGERKNWIRALLKEYKKRGIYILRDGGDGIFASKLARELAEEEGMIFKSPIYALYKKGCYGSFLGKPIIDLEDFKREFNILLEYKPDHLKVVLTGLVSFKKYGEVGKIAFKVDEIKYMVDKAAEYDLPVMVHANGVEGVDRAIAAGVHTIEHGYFISEAQIYKMAEKEIMWIPTLSPLGNILNWPDSKFSEKEKEVISRVYKEQLENVKKGLKMGAFLALGSDAGAYGVEHGKGLFDEIEHLQKIGLDSKEIEKMSFQNGIKALKLGANELSKLFMINDALQRL